MPVEGSPVSRGTLSEDVPLSDDTGVGLPRSQTRGRRGQATGSGGATRVCRTEGGTLVTRSRSRRMGEEGPEESKVGEGRSVVRKSLLSPGEDSSRVYFINTLYGRLTL